MENMDAHQSVTADRRAVAQPSPAATTPRSKSRWGKTNGRSRLAKGVLLMLGVVLLLVAGWLSYHWFAPQFVDSGKYQALFLTNGQVYFGKLEKPRGDFVVLSDIFYLQTSGDTEANNPQEGEGSSNNVQLIKLGTEVHGPEDKMIVSRSQVLFFENLKDDSNVVKSIKQYNESNPQ